ncbi:MAG: hypothetical protein ACRCX2_04945 [Paraclostridium sp.]
MEHSGKIICRGMFLFVLYMLVSCSPVTAKAHAFVSLSDKNLLILSCAFLFIFLCISLAFKEFNIVYAVFFFSAALSALIKYIFLS